MSERWLPVPGYELIASSEGRIARPSGRVLAQGTDRNGYRFVRFWLDGRSVSRMVGPLVCAAFHGPRPSPIHEADHRDECRSNNAEWNLRWLTKRANQARATTNAGRKLPTRPNAPRGEAASGARLTEAQVREILSTYRRRVPGRDLAAQASKYGVSIPAIWGILSGRSWKHIPRKQRHG